MTTATPHQPHKPDQENYDGIWMPRRDFFSKLTWAAFGAAAVGTMIASLRMLFPKVLFEPSLTFKAGFPQDYQVAEVSERWKKRYRVWIVRTEEGFFALSAKCTHLGCTPRWQASENKFKCPCHGSGFFKTGLNFEGPAPRPLDRFKIAVGDDGQLVVDKSKVFKMNPGTEPGEQFPESVLKV